MEKTPPAILLIPSFLSHQSKLFLLIFLEYIWERSGLIHRYNPFSFHKRYIECCNIHKRILKVLSILVANDPDTGFQFDRFLNPYKYVMSESIDVS